MAYDEGLAQRVREPLETARPVENWVSVGVAFARTLPSKQALAVQGEPA